LPPTAGVLSLPVATAAQGCPRAAVVLVVWHGGGSRAAVLPCRCAVARRHTLNPVAELMPDRCTPEYECVIAKMGSLLPYRRARTLLSDFLPIGDVPAVETTRRRRVGARLEQLAVASQPPAPAAEAQAIALSIDGGQSEVIRFARLR
jgi:hypothetical protein